MLNGYECYVYPKIQFGKNGTGNLLVSGKEMEFTYVQLPNDTIKFDFFKENQNSFEQSEVFYYESGTVKGFEQIDLFRIEDISNIYSLVRETPNKKE